MNPENGGPMTIHLGARPIGAPHPPLVVAELSGNHNQSLERALGIVEAAAAAGAQAVKLQTYTADTMTIDAEGDDFHIDDKSSLWKGDSLHRLYQKAHTPWEWHKPLFDRCQALGLACFSTPFDESAVDFLESLHAPAYKIASFELTHLPLIKKAAATGKPLILSTGMASLAELDEAVSTARSAGCKELVLLKCTSSYPASPTDTNLLTIPHLKTLFNVEVGISDHTLGVGVALAGVALGAVMIEKHFTLSRADGGVDAAFSAEPAELRMLVEESAKAWQALGRVSYGPTEKEKASLQFRRSIYVVQDVRAGDSFTAKNLRIIRPGKGLPPRYLDVLLGKKASSDIKRGTPMKWELVA